MYIGIVLVGLPFYSLLTLPIYIITAVTGIVIVQITRQKMTPPGRLVLLLATLVVIALIVYSYGTIFGLVPGTVLVLMLCLLKLFELRRTRDISLVIFLCLFVTASNFFHSQSFWIAMYMFVVVTYLVSLLVLVNDRTHATSLGSRMSLAGRLIMYAVPLMLVLFFTFPRLASPLWSLPEDNHSSRTGISDEMSPGNISRLIRSSAVAFRVKFDGDVPQKKDLYWRGLVLSDYDGKTWRRGFVPYYAYPNIYLQDTQSDIYRYTVTLEPTRENWLFSLESLIEYNRSFRLNREMQLTIRDPINNVFQYRLKSSSRLVNAGLFDEEWVKYLSLPQGFNPDTVRFARQQLQRAGGDERLLIDNLLAFFNQEAFYYTLQPPPLGRDAVDDFIFRSRKGFCEHYASSFVFMMRAAGVPARVVVGYQGGELNPKDNYMIVRQSDAHAWAEVWVQDRWVRVDPTAAVAPDRIERGVQYAGLETSQLPMLLMTQSPLLRSMMYQWDSFQYNWNQWVVGFDSDRQKQLFKNLGWGDVDVADLVLWLVIAMTVTGNLIALWILFVKHSRQDAVQKAYDQLCRKLAKIGLEKSRYEGAVDFQRRVVAQRPALADKISALTGLYSRIRYGVQVSEEMKRRFVRGVRLFKA